MNVFYFPLKGTISRMEVNVGPVTEQSNPITAAIDQATPEGNHLSVGFGMFYLTFCILRACFLAKSTNLFDMFIVVKCSSP